jgi:hypothetical protein
MAVILVTLNHLILFARIKNSWKLMLILSSFVSAFGDITSGWFIRYLSPLFAYLKIISVVVLQVSLALLLLLITRFLYEKK